MKMMNTFNKFFLDITVAIIDFLYRGRDYQRFWVLEGDCSGTIFCFLEHTTLERVYGITWARTHLSDGGTFCSNS